MIFQVEHSMSKGGESGECSGNSELYFPVFSVFMGKSLNLSLVSSWG